MGKQTLFQISEDLMAFDQLLADHDNDIEDPEVQAVLVQWANEIKDNMEWKVDNYVAFIQILLARADARKAESKRLANRAKVDENTAKKLKENLMHIFEFHGIKKMETARFQVGVQANGGKAPLEVDLDPEQLPDWARIEETVYKQNSDAIREKLDEFDKAGDGEILPFARIGERGKGLRIR